MELKWKKQFPEGDTVTTTIEAHTAGEPLRILISGISELDFLQMSSSSSSESKRLDKMIEKWPWNLKHIGMRRRERKKGGRPKMLTDVGERIGEGGQRFRVPGCLPDRKRLPV